MLRSLTNRWLPKITTIQEAKDLTILSLEQLIGSLMTRELILDSKANEPKNKDLALKNVLEIEDSNSDDDVALLTRRFLNFLKKNINSNHRRSGNFKGKGTTSN